MIVVDRYDCERRVASGLLHKYIALSVKTIGACCVYTQDNATRCDWSKVQPNEALRLPSTSDLQSQVQSTDVGQASKAFRLGNMETALFSRGLDLHATYYSKWCAWIQLRPRRDSQRKNWDATPNSLAMDHSQSFFHFRDMLRDLDTDFKAFIKEKLEQAALTEAGWTHETLLTYFELECTPFCKPERSCPRGPTWSWHANYGEPPAWSDLLERLRCGKPQNLNLADLMGE